MTGGVNFARRGTPLYPPNERARMNRKDTAVTFYVIGLLSGLIVAFASCSTDAPGADPPPQPTQVSPRHYR